MVLKDKTAIFAIKRTYFNMIFDGKKDFEYRKDFIDCNIIYFYVLEDEMIMGKARHIELINTKAKDLWTEVNKVSKKRNKKLGIAEKWINEYYKDVPKNEWVYAYLLGEKKKNYLTLEVFGKTVKDFKQSMIDLNNR